MLAHGSEEVKLGIGANRLRFARLAGKEHNPGRNGKRPVYPRQSPRAVQSEGTILPWCGVAVWWW